MNRILATSSVFLWLSAFALAQPPAPPPSQQPANQLTTQVLADMLRSATSFHDLVQNLNLNRSLGPDVHEIGPSGLPQHSIERTAATIGAGAGVGVAIGELSPRPNGVLIGAFIGGAGGLIIDEIIKHREQNQLKPVPLPVP